MRRKPLPTPVPRSRELSTLMERSGFTLPIIWTPFPAERWASCRRRHLLFSTVFLLFSSVFIRRNKRRRSTYTIQIGSNVPIGIDNRTFTAELDDLPDDDDIFADVRVEIPAGNTWGCLGFHSFSVRTVVGEFPCVVAMRGSWCCVQC